MTSGSVPANFMVTKEYRRVAAFCDACRRDRYIGVCYGPPGVGKTLAARYYAIWFRLEPYPPYKFGPEAEFAGVVGSTTVFYTPEVANAPRRLVQDIQLRRHHLWTLPLEALYRTQETEQQAMRQQAAAKQRKRTTAPARQHDVPPHHLVSVVPTAADITQAYAQKREETSDPTTLVIIDETDRLKTASLEQVRDIFDGSDLGVVLLGMPGVEKRLSRYPQLYSRVGFVHAFRPLSPAEARHLLHDNAVSFGVALPEYSLTDEEVLAVILRITGGNFRLLHRLLTQVARLVDINALTQVTREVVEAARECLVIGTT